MSNEQVWNLNQMDATKKKKIFNPFFGHSYCSIVLSSQHELNKGLISQQLHHHGKRTTQPKEVFYIKIIVQKSPNQFHKAGIYMISSDVDHFPFLALLLGAHVLIYWVVVYLINSTVISFSC